MPLQSSVLNAVKTRASGGYPSEEEVDLAIATLLGNTSPITNKTQLVWLARLLLSDAVVDIVHHVNIALEHSPILSGRFQQLLLRSLRLASKVQSLRLELPLGNRGATFCTAIVKSIASQQLSSLYSMTTLTHRNIHYLLRPHPSPGQTRPLKCVAFHKCRRCPESDRSIGPHLQKLKAQAQCISRLVPGSPVEKVVVCNSGVPAIPYLSTLKETTAAVTAVTVPLSQFEEDLVVGLVRNLHRVEVLTLLEPVGTSNTSYPWWHDDKSLSHIWYLGLHAATFS
ncbi:hypothetical protein DL96DRAFT_1717986 [Flagelloscypha sp. PMI_526]|nr:hypothetical protein DL96DRAFT_1717986 [Flagelloscypha sp. PMI_526]